MPSFSSILLIISNFYHGFYTLPDLKYYLDREFKNDNITFFQQRNEILFQKETFKFENLPDTLFMNFNNDIFASQLKIQLHTLNKPNRLSISFEDIHGENISDLLKRNNSNVIEVMYLFTNKSDCNSKKFDISFNQNKNKDFNLLKNQANSNIKTICNFDKLYSQFREYNSKSTKNNFDYRILIKTILIFIHTFILVILFWFVLSIYRRKYK